MPDTFLLAMYLDVCLKDFSFVLNENQQASLVARAKELCQQCLEMPEDALLSQGTLLSQEIVGGGGSLSSRSSSSHEHKKRLALLFGEDLAKTTESLREESADELEVYHKLRSIPFAVDGKVANPLDWWKTHHLEFLKLAKLAWRFLCIIALSVPCEQVFSKSGMCVSKQRTLLSDENVSNLVFIASNL